MKPVDIGKAYNQITHLWESPDFNRSNGSDAHKRAIAFTNSRGYALDVGCGCTGRFIELLQSEGFVPEGVDVSSEMLRLAKIRHPEINFYNEDICEWNPPRKYDFITAWDSIWHVPMDQHAFVLSKLVSCLNKDGILIFSCGGIEEKHEHVDNTMGPYVYYSALGIAGTITLMIELGCGIRHFEFDQYPELHAYFIIQNR